MVVNAGDDIYCPRIHVYNLSAIYVCDELLGLQVYIYILDLESRSEENISFAFFSTHFQFYLLSSP